MAECQIRSAQVLDIEIVKTVCHEWHENSDQFSIHILAYSDADATIQTLSTSYLLCIISNISIYSIATINRLSFMEHIQYKNFSCDLGVMKPDLSTYYIDDVFNEYTKYFVGDGEHSELKGAKQAGYQTILIDRNLRHSKKAQCDADFTIKDLAEIPALLDAL